MAGPGRSLEREWDSGTNFAVIHGSPQTQRGTPWHMTQQIRTAHGPKNMATVRHMAMNLLRRSHVKDSLKTRLKAAAWNQDYLRSVLTQTA